METAGPWSVGAVARRLGVAPATLRTWDRRYGLGPSVHKAGAHRRYDAADLSRLQQMTALVRQGIPTAEAAARVAATRMSTEVNEATGSVEPDPAAAGLVVPQEAAPPTPDEAPALSAETKRRRRGLARASIALDTSATRAQVHDALAKYGIAGAWSRLLHPMLVEAGLRWEVTGAGVDIEHLLSNCIIEELHIRAAQLPDVRDGRPALLGCAPGDQHQLPLHLLAAVARERGIPTRLLGADTPVEAFATAARRVGASSVLVWSQLRRTADPAHFAALPRLRPPVAMFAAGDGWRDVALPDDVQRVETLDEALDGLATAAGLLPA